MEHTFNTDVAKDVGLLGAVLLNNINFWIQKNKANGKHYYDDCYWTYNSARAFAELFPYVTEKQIRYALNKLEKENYIITGNYNAIGYDHTKWYTLTEKATEVLNPLTNHESRSDKIGKPIPDIKTDIIYEDEQSNTELLRNLIEQWNLIADKRRFKKTAKINPKRKGRLNQLLKWCTQDEILQAMKNFQSNAKYDKAFYCGDNDNKWIANFDWFLEDKTITSLLEEEPTKPKVLYDFG